jgi:arylformamidase
MMHLKGATPAVLDSLYNARLALPNAPAQFQDWSDQSAHCRSRLACILDLPYGDSALQRLDYFPAAARLTGNAAPLLIFIHGGYWRSRDKSEFSFVAQPYLKAGINVAVVNYDLLPTTSIQTICLQLVSAVLWLAARHERLGFEVNQMTVAGHSAGGHLAAMIASTDWAVASGGVGPATHLPNLIAHFAALSGLFDLAPLTRAPFLRDDLKLAAQQALSVSPAWFPAPNGCSGLVAVGELESAAFHEQAALLEQNWSTAVRQNLVVGGANHLTICSAMAEEKSPLTRALIDLILS